MQSSKYGISVADDYAHADIGEDEAYYGYEFGKIVSDNPDEDGADLYGFSYKAGRGGEWRISFPEMRAIPGCPIDSFNCAEMLIFGLALFLDRFQMGTGQLLYECLPILYAALGNEAHEEAGMMFVRVCEMLGLAEEDQQMNIIEANIAEYRRTHPTVAR